MNWHNLEFDRKTQLFLGVVAIAILVLLWPASPPQPKRPPARPAPKPQAQPQVNRAGAPAPGAPGRGNVTPAPPPPAPFQQQLGMYQGNEVLPGSRGGCQLHLELTRTFGKPGEFTAYTRLACRPMLRELILARKMTRLEAMKVMEQAQNPTVAVLTGSAAQGSIELHAEKNIGVRDALHGCEMTALTLTPGGKDTVDVEWQEASDPSGLCRGAQMQLRRVTR